MKLLVVPVLAVFGLAVVGCGARKQVAPGENPEGTTLTTSEAELVDDDQEAADTDGDAEAGLDEPLSGAAPSDPGNPAPETDVLVKVKTNPGLFFRPAGCLTTTLNGNVATHVFNNCTGPYGMLTFNGTVTTTYDVEPGKLTITTSANGFTINGATITGTRVVVYTRSGTVITKVRTGTWSGTTAKGKPISHTANFTTTYDTSTRCLTRDGTAETTIGGRSLERTIDGFKRCGIGRLGCPESGTITLTRTKGGDSLTLKIEFMGGRDVEITRPDGDVVDRKLLCVVN